MNKEIFIKKLNKYLNHLTIKEKKEELEKYQNLDNYDLNPIEIANNIYQKRNIKYRVTSHIKLFEATNIIINNFRKKDQKITQNIILFFLYLIVLLIIIKIPYIYVRDMISTLFTEALSNDLYYTIWALTIEFAYAATTIIIFIKLIKEKALELNSK